MAIDSEGHRRVMADFADAILTGGDPFVDGREERQSLELVLAIYAASNSREG